MSTIKKTLEKRRQVDERAERILTDALRGRGGAITRADAVALTGLPTDDTEFALRTLLSRYRSHLDVTDQGELVYRFDPKMERRDAITLGERLRQVGQALWKGFTFLFKIWIVATLVVYTALFLAMMVALVLARSGSDRDDDRDGGFGISPWLLWWLLPDWGPGHGYGRRYDPYGDGGPWGRPRQLAGRRPSKRFYQSVFDFVFGPKQPPPDPLAADREAVALLRSADGRITTSDVVALTGWSYDRADEEMTRLLVDYDGVPEVQEDGSIVYTFPSLRRTAGEVGAGTYQLVWDKPRALPPLTGNTGGSNAGIAVMNGFNLLAAFTIAPAFMQRFGLDPQLGTLLMAFPAAFSGIFYAVPGVRALVRGRRARRLLDETARAAVLREIVERRGGAATPAALIEGAARRGVGLEPARLSRALEKLLRDLEGDVVNGEDGAVQYRFPRLQAELAAASEARRLAPAAEREIGELVFSSEAEGSGELPRLPERPPPKALN